MATKGSSNNGIRLIGTFILSLLFSISFAVINYLGIIWLKSVKGWSEEKIDLYTSMFSSSLFIIIFLLTWFIITRSIKNNTALKELVHFKTYTETLHTAQSESEVFNILFKFIKNMLGNVHVAIYFKTNKTTEDAMWERILSNPLPLCNFSHKYCPATTQGKECIVKSLGQTIPCAYQLSEYKYGGYICIIINDGNGICGILQVYSQSTDYFTDQSIMKIKSYLGTVLPVLASKSAIISLNKEAYTDKLTQVYNRAFFETLIERLSNESKANDKPLSLIMLDIDLFKKVNDTYGHDAGDVVLQTFAQVISRGIRKKDYVSRHGGEEFIVLLPETDTQTAAIIAERLRISVEQETMPILNNIQIPNINCSLGVSTFPFPAETKEALLKTADMALYKAKLSGRNKVIKYVKKVPVPEQKPTEE